MKIMTNKEIKNTLYLISTETIWKKGKINPFTQYVVLDNWYTNSYVVYFYMEIDGQMKLQNLMTQTLYKIDDVEGILKSIKSGLEMYTSYAYYNLIRGMIA